MKPKTLVIVAIIAVFVVGIGYALLREIGREEAMLSQSISGVVKVDRALFARGLGDIVKTDRLVLVLVDPATREPVAMRFESPLVPPQTIRIGADDSLAGRELDGAYLMIGITDKDGEIFKATAGEVYGRSPQPIPIGAEKVSLVLNEPFRGSLFNERRPATAGAGTPAPAPPAGGGSPPPASMAGRQSPPLAQADPRYSVAGTIVVSQALQSRVAPTDRLVILLFAPGMPQPAAFKIIPHAYLPQRFTITLPTAARADAKPGYFLRVLTDKDQNIFGSAEGEVIGRSSEPIPLGTSGVVFELDQPYQRQ